MFEKGSWGRVISELGVEMCSHFAASGALKTVLPVQTHPVAKVVQSIGSYSLSSFAAKVAKNSLFEDVDEIRYILKNGFTIQADI